MANRWTDNEKEQLYFVAKSHYLEINNYKIIQPDSEIAHIIYQDSSSLRSVIAVLYQLEEMGFVKKGKNTYRDNHFYVKTLRQSDFLNFSVSPKYEPLTLLEETDFKSCYEMFVLEIDDVEQLVEKISKFLKLSSLRIKKELFNLKLIKLNTLMYYELVYPINEKTKDQKLKAKSPSREYENRLNALRKDIAYIYDTHSKLNPSITYSSDGTGTGKSYSVINSFIQQTDVNNISNGHRNLLFLTPQKSQIDIADNLKKEAEDKGIKILSFLSQEDITNIEFKDWVTKKISKDIFKNWIKELKNDSYLTDYIEKLDNSVRNAEIYNTEIPKAKKRGELEVVEEYEERQKKNNYNLRKALENLACAILQEQRNGKYISIEERFKEAGIKKDGKPNKAAILSEIIDFVLPFEWAKISPCILLATSDKFDYNVNIAVENKKDNKPVIKSLAFDYIIGQKIKPDSDDEERRTADKNGKSFYEQVEFLKNDYFLTDENNYFRKKAIAFTLIVDEEHIAYNKFFNRSHKKLIAPNTQIAHVFSVVHRIVKSFESVTKENRDDFVLYEAHESFVSELKRLFETQCEVSNGVTLDGILRIFSNNLHHIVIDNSELEQIIHICKNVFSITPKRYFNEAGLKKIRIKSRANDTECQIYFDRDRADKNPTMHDILQALMCVFCACSHIKDEDFRYMIRHGAENSQNSLLVQFMQNARSNRTSIDSMFDRVNDESLYVDDFFTYFTPKIVFSIEKVNDLPFKSEQLKNKVYVTFQLDLFEDLPEVTLMRVLHNTQNAVICLSATSGFKDSFNGNYCRQVMEKYGSHPENNLGYHSVRRLEEDAEKLQQLRECRSEIRKVSINLFLDTKRNKITELRNKNEFLEIYKFWFKSLKPHFKTSSIYRLAEFERQIEAILLAAYDKKNSLILSLSNDFLRVMRDFIKSENGKLLKGINIIDEENFSIFEIKPFDNGATLRIILFNAKLAKDLNINDYLTLKNQEVKIAFISSYQSAGTGLNLFTRYENENIEEDFERLVLINSPFYSDIRSKTNGLNSIENYLLLLKHYAADESFKCQLKEFDVNLVHGRNYKILMQEHNMSVLKDIMQAVGRVERRDTCMETEIFLPADIIDDLAIQFSRLKKQGNELIFQSMSLLNYKLMEYCLKKAVAESFKTAEEREDFSSKMADDWEAIDSFCNNDLNHRLNDARRGDKSATKLNDALRSMDCIENPQRYINNLLALPEIKNDEYFQFVISKFYLDENISKSIRLCTKQKNRKTMLTDLTEGDSVYKPYESILPKYHKAVDECEFGSANKILKPIFNLEKNLSKEILPHPALLPMFKGNIGEYLFKQCLEFMDITPLTLDQMFTKLEPSVYELFDFYVLSDEKLFCIDVKNWSATFDKEDLARETHEKALRKREQLMQIAIDKKFRASFIYINTHLDKNALNIQQEFDDDGNIHYMNLFKVITQYTVNDKPNPKKKSILKNRLDINSSLIKLLGGL